MLAILTTHPIQYQVPLWQLLAEDGRVPFEVWYLSSHAVEQSYDREFSSNFAWDIDMIEEEIFYPAARKAGVDSDLLDEAQIEHGSIKQLIAAIGAAQASESLYDARLQVLGEYVRHHVKEEESELFPACRKSEMDMGALGARLQKRKDQLIRKLGAN